ncbi:MAG: hypothetical protein JO368_08095 [Acidimicrobiales bacterium]|nr:hypothetical protein [Acidimicrobiales bacterium]
MARTKEEIRSTAAEARADVASTLSGVADKVDLEKVGAAAKRAGGQAKEHLGEYASQAKAKASDLRDQAGGSIPSHLGALEHAVGLSEERGGSASRPKITGLLVGVLVVVLAAVVLRRLWGEGTS